MVIKKKLICGRHVLINGVKANRNAEDLLHLESLLI